MFEHVSQKTCEIRYVKSIRKSYVIKQQSLQIFFGRSDICFFVFIQL